jgi:AcrR family transcriptional regulator
LTRKEQIILKAASLFRQRGFAAVTMRDIAADMDMKAASLYNHITSKQEILTALIMSVATKFTVGMQEISEMNDSAFAKAKKLIALHIDIAQNHTDAIAVMNNDWMHLEGSAYERYKNMRRDYEANFIAILKSGMASGEFKSYDLELTTFTMLSTLRTLHLWIPKRTQQEVNRLKAELPQLLIEGLK